jgi:hypothetical protein
MRINHRTDRNRMTAIAITNTITTDRHTMNRIMTTTRRWTFTTHANTRWFRLRYARPRFTTHANSASTITRHRTTINGMWSQRNTSRRIIRPDIPTTPILATSKKTIKRNAIIIILINPRHINPPYTKPGNHRQNHNNTNKQNDSTTKTPLLSYY